MAEPFPDLEAALGTIMFHIACAVDAPPEREAKLEAVRVALVQAWPDELRTSLKRTVWQTLPDGGVRALYEKEELAP